MQFINKLERKVRLQLPWNVTDYSVASISHLKNETDLSAVWQKQKPPKEFIDNVDHIAPIVGDTIKTFVTNMGLYPES